MRHTIACLEDVNHHYYRWEKDISCFDISRLTTTANQTKWYRGTDYEYDIHLLILNSKATVKSYKSRILSMKILTTVFMLKNGGSTWLLFLFINNLSWVAEFLTSSDHIGGEKRFINSQKVRKNGTFCWPQAKISEN